MTAGALQRLAFYAPYMWRTVVGGHADPLIYGIVLTDHCNLRCRGCTVANTGRRPFRWDQLVEAMAAAHDRGFRELYFSGGEPMLWRDGDRSLDDAIAAARRIGFFHVHVYTNGTLGVGTSADVVWVSMDGLPGTFELRRGDHFARVEAAVRRGDHPKVAVIYTVDRLTAGGVEAFLTWVRDTALPVMGVMFYFHTPYYGYDELFLDRAERAAVIDRLIRSIRDGLPVLNSIAGLRALRSGAWPRRLPIAAVLDIEGESVCCRAGDETCVDCGYAACTELTEMRRLRLSAVRRMFGYW